MLDPIVVFLSLHQWGVRDDSAGAVITAVIRQIPMWKSAGRFRVNVAPMKMQHVNALIQKGLNEVPFADVGIEPNGTTLTLVTVFARLGSGPWAEADRLASLSRPAAIESLARTIAWRRRRVSTLAIVGLVILAGFSLVATMMPESRMEIVHGSGATTATLP